MLSSFRLGNLLFWITKDSFDRSYTIEVKHRIYRNIEYYKTQTKESVDKLVKNLIRRYN